ncbi:hypothetical protein BS47DRAFT_1448807, partial [Hydnum rufescens UP504]
SPPNNRSGAFLQEDFVNKYISDELSKGRLAGPYTFDEVVTTYGHFFCSPLDVVEKPHVPDAQGISVNDLLDPDDYPTIWDGAEKLAAYMSQSLL